MNICIEKDIALAIADLVSRGSQNKHAYWDWDYKVVERKEDCGSDTQATGMTRCQSSPNIYVCFCFSVYPMDTLGNKTSSV